MRLSLKRTEKILSQRNNRQIMDLIPRRNNSPQIRRLAQHRRALSQPRTLRLRYHLQLQRTVFAPSRSNKLSNDENAEFDAELLQPANGLGCG